jgi:hypothetical protein
MPVLATSQITIAGQDIMHKSANKDTPEHQQNKITIKHVMLQTTNSAAMHAQHKHRIKCLQVPIEAFIYS